MKKEDINNETSAEASRLIARELPSAINSAKLEEEHETIMNGYVRTRFPPEVIVYQHIVLYVL